MSNPDTTAPDIFLRRLFEGRNMDNMRKKLFGSGNNKNDNGHEYEPVTTSREALLSQDREYRAHEDEDIDVAADEPDIEDEDRETGGENDEFSWLEYAIFLLLGVAMLWAWNMFLAAAPYFQRRFHDAANLETSFQASEISVSTLVNFFSVIVLTKLQSSASYPRRIIISLVITTICFTLLAISTAVDVSAGVYFGFLMVMVAGSSAATGLIQNGLFAYAGGYGGGKSAGRYMQGIMTGQAVAGVLPCVAQIVSVQAVGRPKNGDHGPPPPDGKGEGDRRPPPPHPLPPSLLYKSARVYFILATSISVAALLAFLYLLRRQRRRQHQRQNLTSSTSSLPSPGSKPTKSHSIPLSALFLSLPSLSIGVFLTFAITMFFPVFTAIIPSVHSNTLPPPTFIPLSFLLWNSGDLTGRLLTLSPRVHLYHRPRLLLCLAVARVVFIPLYFLCNIRGRGAVVNSDFFYLVVVQALFGLTNGYVGSECMVGAGWWIEKKKAAGRTAKQLEEEKNAAGAWMGLCLVGGLTVGSLASFGIVGAV